MNTASFTDALHTTDDPMLQMTVEKVTGRSSQQVLDCLAIEEPLEIQPNYGASNSRKTRSISVTMRTPGNDFDLAAGFLMTEGVIRDATTSSKLRTQETPSAGAHYPLRPWIRSSLAPNRMSFGWIWRRESQ